MLQNITDNYLRLVQVMAWYLRQQAIIWANVDPDLCHLMASLGNNDLIHNYVIHPVSVLHICK